VTLTAHSSVATTAAARYAKQLASHLGRKLSIEDVSEDVTVIRFPDGGGECVLTAGAAALEMAATAPDVEAMERVQRVVGGHLERFGQRNELVVEWE
jgi:hypothetical protein